MWKKLRRTLTGPEIPTIPWQMVVPTQGLFGSARIIVDWHPRTIAVELAQAPRFVLTDMGLPRFMATSLPPPRAVASTPEKVTLTVNGAPTPIAVGRRAMRRSTYIASVFVAGITYKLVPITVRKAKFYRNGEVISELASSKINGLPETISWSPTATPQDTAVAILLAHTLGVGARGFTRNFLKDLDIFPAV